MGAQQVADSFDWILRGKQTTFGVYYYLYLMLTLLRDNYYREKEYKNILILIEIIVMILNCMKDFLSLKLFNSIF